MDTDCNIAVEIDGSPQLHLTCLPRSLWGATFIGIIDVLVNNRSEEHAL